MENLQKKNNRKQFFPPLVERGASALAYAEQKLCDEACPFLAKPDRREKYSNACKLFL